MHFYELILIALGLALDACAVAIAVGASGRTTDPRAQFRIPFHFGLFQFLMPVVGWEIGRTVEPLMRTVDHWVAFILLGAIGVKMIRSGFGSGAIPSTNRDPSRGWSLVFLSVATSIDALVVGFSLAVLELPIVQACVLIGLVTGLLSSVGLRLGRRLGTQFGNRLERAGGVLLILIGLHILLRHTIFA